MVLVVFSRLRRHISPATAGTDHTSHRLVRLGYTRREAVMGLYLIGGMLGLIAQLIVLSETLTAYGILILVGVAAIVALWQLEKIPLGAFPTASQKDPSP
jgi:UDP-GlcNAc:undecaprenyl-phosphate GlcNAc-1-phosphate transferase